LVLRSRRVLGQSVGGKSYSANELGRKEAVGETSDEKTSTLDIFFLFYNL
jgi:hypothetical protein